MKKAIIDIGSNSIRLTLYEVENNKFTILFREKVMAALAGYVREGIMSEEGIAVACTGLLSFKNILQTLNVDDVNVFATASLRNITNTEQAVKAIQAATGYSVEIISGDDEALLGYTGAMTELHMKNGAFVDIGGASTEIVSFSAGKATLFSSVPIGSLNLYHQCVKKILPGEGSIKRIQAAIENALKIREEDFANASVIVGVGGTARAVLKIAEHYYGMSGETNSLTVEQIDGLYDFLRSGKKDAGNLILRIEAERIHTLIPGLMILRHIIHRFQAKKIVVSKYGVREGYLCRIMQQESLDIPRTEN